MPQIILPEVISKEPLGPAVVDTEFPDRIHRLAAPNRNTPAMLAFRKWLKAGILEDTHLVSPVATSIAATCGSDVEV
jgi:hypothetical protein